MANWLHKTTLVYRQSSDPDLDEQVNWLRNPDLTAVLGQPLKYWIVEGDSVRLATAQEQATANANEATAAANAAIALLASQREASIAAIAEAREEAFMIVRALALVTLDEVNAIRQTLALLKSGTAASGTFAAFKTAVATLNSNTHRTKQQLRTAIDNKISDGLADE